MSSLKPDHLRAVARGLLVLLAVSGIAAAQEAKLDVSLTLARATVFDFQTVDLKVVFTNSGSAPTRPLDRAGLVGDENLLCALPAWSGPERKGTWARPVGGPRSGTIVLHPGESLTIPVEVELPAELVKGQRALSLQWVGKNAKKEEMRSAEVQVTIQPGKHPVARIVTTQGKFYLELWEDKAPNHVANFIHLARKRFFDGLQFHRAYPNFIIQTGSPDGSAAGGPGYSIANEINDTPFRKGVVGMATLASRKDTAGSQWFVCVADALTLNDKFTAFGKVLEGQDVADKISRVPGQKGRPNEPVTVRSVTVGWPQSYKLPDVVKVGDKKKDGEKNEDGGGAASRPEKKNQ